MILAFSVEATAWAQDQSVEPDAAGVDVTLNGESAVDVAEKVEVDPVNTDSEIAERISEILDATRWFENANVSVDGGVAFLDGVADTQAHRAWAEQTAMRTTDVVAVVNRLTVAEKPFWNFDPAIESLKQLARETTMMLPLILIAVVIIFLSYYVAKFGAAVTRWTIRGRIDSSLLRGVAGNAAGVVIFIIGVYIALRVSGLTRLAVTLLGGTGLVGLALGFAFRDIAENYLASILISLNHPFRVDDLIVVDGTMGFVRKVTTRGTVLGTVEGNQVQIPNSIVYKNKVLNYTATPLTRLEFGVGIGFDDSITEAQRLIMQVFADHHAVENEPEPLVLAESLGSATVNLKCYCWIDQVKHSKLKVNSSVVRQVKKVLTTAGITMPDEAREIIFPHGVPVQMLDTDHPVLDAPATKEDTMGPSEARESVQADEADVNAGEGDLRSERDDVRRVTEGEGAIASETNLLQ